MKKTFFLALGVAAMSFVSCGNKTNEGENVDSAEVVDTVVVAADDADAVVAQLTELVTAENKEGVATIVEQVQQKISELISAGKAEEAAAYAKTIQEYLKANADQIKAITNGNETISNIVNAVVSLPTDAQTITTAAAGLLEATAVNAAENVKNAAEAKANEVVENAKEQATQKVNEQVQKANDKVNEKVNEGVQKANDAVNKAASGALKKLGI